MNAIQSTVIPVPEALRRDVAYIRIMSHNGDEALAIHTSPNAAPGIVFQHIDGRPALENIITPRHRVAVPTLFVYGTGIDPSVMHYKAGSYTTTQIVLKPHALHSLLGLNAATLNHYVAELNEFARDDLNEQLMNATHDKDPSHILMRFLTKRLQEAPARDSIIEEGLRLIHTAIPTITIKSLLEHLNISERQFERRFIQTVGVTPQSYIRVKRFNEALRLIAAGRHERLTDVAHAMNYYDQSHFIRDIKAFSGMSPRDLMGRNGADLDEQAGFSWLET